MDVNPLLNSDSYKASHWLQYPPGIQNVFSYIEARGGKYPHTLFYGLQAFLEEYLSVPVTSANVRQAERIIKAHGEPFNLDGWATLISKHEGRLPIRVRAVPEGTVVPVSNCLVTVEATDPAFYWLTSYVETAILRAVWYPTTVATQSFEIKKLIKRFLDRTADSSEGLPFKLHDFGARGVSSYESACIGGSAHLINFLGSDTMSALDFVMRYYGETEVPGFSIPAAEHSTITCYGQEPEVDAYRNMLKQYAKPGALVAVVSDSYDIYNACTEIWGKQLKQEVIDSGATIIIRPDSGWPPAVVSECLRRLDAAFGHTVNSKGYKLLNHVRVIQGDGINQESIKSILTAVQGLQYSTDNVAFGMGGALLQQVNRDTQCWAMKCSAMQIDGEWRDVWKKPVTDSGKDSKRGRVELFSKGDEFVTKDRKSIITRDHIPVMQTVFENGEMMNKTTFSEIRKRSEEYV